MNAVIVTIGNELLQGFTLDTNASWIGKTLLPYNIQIKKIVTIGDTSDQIVYEINNILKENFNFLFITGGLGPTHDDITKNAFMKIMDDELIFDEKYYKELIQKFNKNSIKMLEMHRSQALRLKKSISIPNDCGTALGIHYSIKDKQIFIMPGVPREMKNMVTKHIVPTFIKLKAEQNIVTIKTFGITESHLSEKVNPLMQKYNKTCKFAFLPHYTGVSFRISKINSNLNLSNIKDEFWELMTPYAYGTDEESLQSIISNKLINLNLTIASAESCTGGLISKYLTDTPGSSSYFLGGITPYNNNLKHLLLNISKLSIKKYGAVSEFIALKMAEQIRLLTNADIGISTTGIAGPGGGTKSKPVGLVYIGLSTKNKNIVKKYIFRYDRNNNRILTAHKALDMIRLLIYKN